MTDGRNICVIGAGIGGLAAAVALRQTGAEVTVLEQAGEITEMGAGLQISANGMAVLRGLNVVGDTPEAGLRSHGTVLRDYRAGRLVSEVPGPAAGSTYYYHRADLIELLHAAAIRSGVEIRLGQQVATARRAGNRAEVEMAGGEVITADCAIAADGGRSTIRTELNGIETPKFTHQVAWRATIPWTYRDDTPRAVLTMGPGRHVVTYPLRDQTLMNIVAVEERSDWREEGWRRQGDPNELRSRFADFGGPVWEMLAQVRETHLWALFLRPVAPSWQNGAVALLGDAAHPTLPFMAQGACLALEDAWVLARSLEGHVDLASALSSYELARKDRARHVVAAAAANARNFHFRSPVREVAQLALRVLGPRLGRRYEWIYSHDVTAG
ncbi:MAG: FAD-dependent monooxygenase [Ruegeria sp.]|uniref:FAD-dependent monooxygenase n=1 Tax=Ruegeria sp. TaxID=1879320 RepID=UPI00349E56FC